MQGARNLCSACHNPSCSAKQPTIVQTMNRLREFSALNARSGASLFKNCPLSQSLLRRRFNTFRKKQVSCIVDPSAGCGACKLQDSRSEFRPVGEQPLTSSGGGHPVDPFTIAPGRLLEDRMRNQGM